MSQAHLTLLSSLLAASIAIPAGAQTPGTTPAADSAKADSAAPKKKSRFGGMMDKAKQVAGNKTVQDAAKGAATGVACTVVPGAAVVGAATGSGPCVNSGLAGMMSGKGVTGAATSIATGAAANAAAKATGNLTGAKGAAAAGALGAVGGQGALSKAATAAAASAMAPKGVTPTAPNMAEAMAAMGAMTSAMNTATVGAGKVEAVDFRELKALLPESLGGLKRSEASGQKQSSMGMQISTAEGQYGSGDGKSVTLTITDMGSLTGVAGMASYAWATTEIDRESDSGYEKTTTFKGFKALEKYSKGSKSGELSVLVEGRFVVEADGNNIEMDAIKSALGSVDLRKLASMKGKGVK